MNVRWRPKDADAPYVASGDALSAASQARSYSVRRPGEHQYTDGAPSHLSSEVWRLYQLWMRPCECASLWEEYLPSLSAHVRLTAQPATRHHAP